MDTPKNESPARLTRLSAQQVRALSPEMRAEWERQCQQENDDFAYLSDFLDSLYPDCRRRFKQLRKIQVTGDATGGSDTPSFRAFGKILALAETFRDDPEFIGRVAGWLPDVVETNRRVVKRNRIKHKIERLTKELESLRRRKDVSD